MISPRYALFAALISICALRGEEAKTNASTTGDAPAPTGADAKPESPPAVGAEVKTEATTASAAAEGTTLASNPIIERVQMARGASAEEIASLVRLGHAKFEKGDYESAEIAYLQVLTERGTPQDDHAALLGLARTYRKKADFTKAAAVYERFVKEYPEDPLIPTVYLELGRTLRALGAYKQAISRFYSVLNTTLKLPDENQEQYRQVARTAQYEIAETYFETGQYEQANHFFSRLKLLDLAPEDRARAHFKSDFAMSLSGDDEKAVAGLQNFLELYPDDENVPEARYLLSVSLRRLGRAQESLRATLDLLRAEESRVQKDPQRWSYWQRRTGNQLANDFYQSGDFADAMQIYEGLVNLSADPTWVLPSKYQLGLCYERLRRFDKARDCYQTILSETKKNPELAPARSGLADLADMAAWRLSQLDWQMNTDNQLSWLFPAPPISDKSSAALIASKTSPDHDLHGNPANAPRAVR